MTILLLGDCVANGQNILYSDIMKTDYITEGLQSPETLQTQIKEWAETDDFKVAKKYLKTQEKINSWPTHIPDCVNMSAANETFQGMHKKLKEYLQKNPKPDLVLLTDFTPSHRCVVLRKNGIQFVVKRDIKLIDNEQEIWPNDVYEMFKNKVREQETNGETYLVRKNLKSFKQLTKLIEKHDIDYKFLVFRHENQNITDDYIYCNPLLDLYKLPGNTENCTEKFKAQKKIANFVMDKLI